jgi:hypothetical protein
MKKYIFPCIVLLALMSCNDAANSNATDDTKTNAAANDSTTAPEGTINSSAISTNPDATKTKTDTTTNK